MANDYASLYEQYQKYWADKASPIPAGSSYSVAEADTQLHHYMKQAVVFTGNSITVTLNHTGETKHYEIASKTSPTDMWSQVIAVSGLPNPHPEVTDRAAYIDAAEHALLDAAMHMEAVGWVAGVECQASTGRVCTWGAVLGARPYEVTAVEPHHRLAMMLIAEYLEIETWRGVITWNDRTLKSQYDEHEIAGKEAVRVMREAWAKSREDRGLL